MDGEWEKQFDEHRRRIKVIGKVIHDNCSDDQQTSIDFLSRLKDIVKDSVDVRTEAARQNAVLQNVNNQVNESEDFDNININEIYEEELRKDVQIQKLDYVKQFNTFITNLKADADTALMTSQEPSVAVDPWTKLPIKNPVKSKICGHIYNKSSISVISKTKREFKCPYIGCKTKLTVNDIEDD